MALSIKSDAADRLARELAAVTGESLNEVVEVSLRERLARQRGLVGLSGKVRRHLVFFDREMAERSFEGWRRFGKGRHPAALNKGDAFTFGVAVTPQGTVLCVGDDFAQTGVAFVRP